MIRFRVTLKLKSFLAAIEIGWYSLLRRFIYGYWWNHDYGDRYHTFISFEVFGKKGVSYLMFAYDRITKKFRKYSDSSGLKCLKV